MYVGLHANCLSLLSDFNKIGIFLNRFSKNTQISNFMKILPLGAASFHAEGHTNRHDDYNGRFFAKFCNAPFLRLCERFSLVPIAAKSACQLRHVHLPLSLSECNGFSSNLVPGELYENLSRNSKLC